MEETATKGGVASEFRTEGDAPATGGTFLKGIEFDNGLTLTVVGMEKFTPANPEYGVKNNYGPGGVVTKENWFVKKGILKEGESFKYRFIVNGVNKEFDNNSLSFYFAFTKVNPEATDTVFIKRTKNSNTDVDWEIKITE